LTTSICSLVAIAALAAAPEVTVKRLDGESQSGRITVLTNVTIGLDAAGKPISLPTSEVMWVEVPSAPPLAEKPTVWIELLDGSKLHAINYTSSGGKARIDLTSGQSVEVPTRGVRTVRFRQQTTPELAGQWREIIDSMATGDVLVIRKTSMRTVERNDGEPTSVTEQALDQLEGTLHDVTPDIVWFEIDGRKVDVRRDKLEGLVYYQPAKREFSPPICRLVDSGGSTWLLSDAKLTGDRLSATTLGNVQLQWPLLAVAKIDFSVGNIAFLSELEPDSGSGEPSLSLQPSGMAYKFGRIFQVRPGPPLGADAFRIGGTRYDSGLSLHSPATLVYRVPQGFRRFRAVVGIDDTIVSPGRFDLVLLGDGRELARHAFPGETSSARRATSIDLDVSSVRRLSIVLEPADGQDIGDQLNLCEARFTK
jgi:hypothetical protein